MREREGGGGGGGGTQLYIIITAGRKKKQNYNKFNIYVNISPLIWLHQIVYRK